eukprot:Colp12_sorted_trinity150504_noHs@9587
MTKELLLILVFMNVYVCATRNADRKFGDLLSGFGILLHLNTLHVKSNRMPKFTGMASCVLEIPNTSAVVTVKAYMDPIFGILVLETLSTLFTVDLATSRWNPDQVYVWTSSHREAKFWWWLNITLQINELWFL